MDEEKTVVEEVKEAPRRRGRKPKEAEVVEEVVTSEAVAKEEVVKEAVVEEVKEEHVECEKTEANVEYNLNNQDSIEEFIFGVFPTFRFPDEETFIGTYRGTIQIVERQNEFVKCVCNSTSSSNVSEFRWVKVSDI